MKRPDVVFTVSVHPVAYVHGCMAKVADEARGFYGFHLADRCPDCRIEAAGWEMWGENGHCQGRAATRELLAHWLRYRARQQWRTQDGRLMGYRFRRGSQLRYVGAPNV